ncbi:MAG: hypothetical protein KF773_22090 [Deltaproteobacteria bacterium]|nr:hypothetical protein [Deltaproteobacteria bacterium]
MHTAAGMTQQQALSPAQILFTSNGGLFRSKWRVHFGRYELTPTHLIWYQRSSFWLAFGALGMLLSRGTSGKRARDFELRAIAKAVRGKHGVNKKILDLTLTDGTTARLSVDKFDELVARLRELGCAVEGA